MRERAYVCPKDAQEREGCTCRKGRQVTSSRTPGGDGPLTGKRIQRIFRKYNEQDVGPEVQVPSGLGVTIRTQGFEAIIRVSHERLTPGRTEL